MYLRTLSEQGVEKLGVSVLKNKKTDEMMDGEGS